MEDHSNDNVEHLKLSIKDPLDPDLFTDVYTMTVLNVALAGIILLSGETITTKDILIITKHLKILEVIPFLHMKDNHTGAIFYLKANFSWENESAIEKAYQVMDNWVKRLLCLDNIIQDNEIDTMVSRVMYLMREEVDPIIQLFTPTAYTYIDPNYQVSFVSTHLNNLMNSLYSSGKEYVNNVEIIETEQGNVKQVITLKNIKKTMNEKPVLISIS